MGVSIRSMAALPHVERVAEAHPILDRFHAPPLDLRVTPSLSRPTRRPVLWVATSLWGWGKVCLNSRHEPPQ